MPQINSRMRQKIDTEVNWNKATNFIPLDGEIIIYKADENYSYERIKIGDGETTVINLAFVNSIDTNLTQSGQAADAKAVGDALTEKANSVHEQAASTITAGTFSGAVTAQTSSQTPATSLLRNSKLATTETNPSNNGEIVWTYS